MVPKGLLLATLIIGLLVAAMAIDQATAETVEEPTLWGGRPTDPPPEAYEACEGKKAGEAVLIDTPRGETIEAVCTVQGGRLLARPINPPPPPDRDEQ